MIYVDNKIACSLIYVFYYNIYLYICEHFPIDLSIFLVLVMVCVCICVIYITYGWGEGGGNDIILQKYCLLNCSVIAQHRV